MPELQIDFTHSRRFHAPAERLTNPYAYYCCIETAQYVKMFLLTFLLLPVRCILAGTSFLLSIIISELLTRFNVSDEELKPFSKPKRFLINTVFYVFARLTFFFIGFHQVRIKGRRATRREAPILVVAPHSSYLDALAVVIMNLPSVLGKSETAQSAVGGLIRITQPILVNRECAASRNECKELLCKRVASEDDWDQVFIFPEGTCSNRSCLLQFKTGAFHPGVPVQPVLLRWPNLVDGHTWTWEGPSISKLTWINLCQLYTRFEIEFLPPYIPNENEMLDPELYALGVRRTMAEALGVPICDWSYSDFCRIRLAADHNLPMAHILPELSSFIHLIKQTQNKLVNGCVSEDAWLLNLINKARHSPDISIQGFVDSFFAGELPSTRYFGQLRRLHEFYLLKETPQLFNLQALALHAVMMVKAFQPEAALYLAARVFEPTLQDGVTIPDDKLPNNTEIWPISLYSAYQLLTTVYSFEHDSCVKDLLNLAMELQPPNDASLLNGLVKHVTVPFILPVSLYKSLIHIAPEKLHGYSFVAQSARHLPDQTSEPIENREKVKKRM